MIEQAQPRETRPQDDAAGKERLYPRRTDSRYHVLVNLRRALEAAIASQVVPMRAERADLTVVDLGCGTMPYRSLFTPYVGRYLGADLPENPLADLPLDARTGRVEMETGSADIVVSTQVLEHVESPEAYLAEAYRLCKPGGLLLLSTHGYWLYHPMPEDYWRWTAAGLCKLLRDQGWQVEEITGILGFAAASLCLLQDAVYFRLPRGVREIVPLVTQRFVGLLDLFYTPKGRKENAAVYLVAARRPGAG